MLHGVLGRSLALPLWMYLAVAAVAAEPEYWPQWRGVRLDGVSHEKGLPVQWSKETGIAWRLPMPGPAGSTPIVWKDQIFVTSVDGEGRLLLLCVGVDGKEQWRREVSRGNRDVRGDEGNSASNSPCTDGHHVWTMMADGVLACYTLDGKETWRLNLAERYGAFNIQFGMTSTPLLHHGRLYLQLVHGDGKAETEEALLACLDAANGSEIWRHARNTGASQENEHSYSSPTLYDDGKLTYLLAHGGDYISAHDLDTGKERWRYCLNPQGALYHPTLRFVASPLAVPGLIVAPSAKNGPVVAIKPDASGDITDNGAAILWRRKEGTPDVPSPVADESLVYLCRENGNLVCVDRQTGETLYEKRTTADRHRSSPVLADGKLYLTARKGVVTVVKAGRDFEILAQNDLGEPTSSSPAIAAGRIYIRTFDALYAIGKP